MKHPKLFAATMVAVCLLALFPAGCAKEEPVTDAKPYPLDTCLVCGMKLSMMGNPVSFVYQGQQIKVCDASEKAEFEKDPAKYIAKLSEAPAVAAP